MNTLGGIWLIPHTLIINLLLFSGGINADPTVTWTSLKLELEQSLGTQAIHRTTISTTEDTKTLIVQVVPELQQWVTVSPATIDGLHSGESFDIAVTVNLPPDAPLGVFKGVLQLTESAPGQHEKTAASTLPIELTITELVDDGLPPDPGDAGRQTLSGIDRDADGVRDDIQRYIYFTYTDSEKTRAALTEVAKQYQALLLQAADPDAVFLHATKMARHGECLDYIKGEAAADILAALRAKYLNTRERSLAYIQYNNTLSGEIIIGMPLAEWKNSCAFDVDAIGENQ